MAEEGDWIIGTGGTSNQSAGHGKLVYAMRVEEKRTRWQYFTDRRFKNKKPVQAGTYERTQGDNEYPRTYFEKHEQFVLVSRHFYYFGANAIVIPEKFDLEKKGPGFRRYFDLANICQFFEWLKKQSKPGKHGEPCYQNLIDNPNRSKRCKSSC